MICVWGFKAPLLFVIWSRGGTTWENVFFIVYFCWDSLLFRGSTIICHVAQHPQVSTGQHLYRKQRPPTSLTLQPVRTCCCGHVTLMRAGVAVSGTNKSLSIGWPQHDQEREVLAPWYEQSYVLFLSWREQLLAVFDVTLAGIDAVFSSAQTNHYYCHGERRQRPW